MPALMCRKTFDILLPDSWAQCIHVSRYTCRCHSYPDRCRHLGKVWSHTHWCHAGSSYQWIRLGINTQRCWYHPHRSHHWSRNCRDNVDKNIIHSSDEEINLLLRYFTGFFCSLSWMENLRSHMSACSYQKVMQTASDRLFKMLARIYWRNIHQPND